MDNWNLMKTKTTFFIIILLINSCSNLSSPVFIGEYTGFFHLGTTRHPISMQIYEEDNILSGNLYSYGINKSEITGVFKSDSIKFESTISDNRYSGTLYFSNDTISGKIIYPITGKFWDVLLVRTNQITEFKYGEYYLKKIYSDSGLILSMDEFPKYEAFLNITQNNVGISFKEFMSNGSSTGTSNSPYEFLNGMMLLQGGVFNDAIPVFYYPVLNELILMNIERPLINDVNYKILNTI